MGGAASPVEGLNYSEEGLKANFKYFRNHPNEAKQYPCKKFGGKITTWTDETAIANRVYANRLGNGNVASGDGSRYCGRGGVHLTGKINYEGFLIIIKFNGAMVLISLVTHLLLKVRFTVFDPLYTFGFVRNCIQ